MSGRNDDGPPHETVRGLRNVYKPHNQALYELL